MARPIESKELSEKRRAFIAENSKKLTILQMSRSLKCSVRMVAKHMIYLGLRRTDSISGNIPAYTDLSKEVGIFNIDVEAYVFGYSDNSNKKDRSLIKNSH